MSMDSTAQNESSTSLEVEGIAGAAPVHRLVGGFLKTLKAFRLYDPTHPVLKGFLTEFYGDLGRHLDENGELSLRVRQFTIEWGSEVVYESEVREESLAFRLFIHGVREFTFHAGIPLCEVHDFVHVLHKTLSSRSSLDDLLSSLWEKDLEHVTFLVLDDFLQEGDQDDFESFVSEGRCERESTGSLRATVQPLLDRLLAQAMSPGASRESQRLGIFELDAREKAHVERLIREEADRNLLQDLCRLILEILGQGEGVGSPRELVGVLENVLLNLLNEGGLEQALWVTAELRRFVRQDDTDGSLRGIRSALGRISGGRLVKALGPHLPRVREGHLEVLAEFLSFLGPEAIDPLLDLVEQPHTYHAAMRILTRVGQKHPSHLLPRLKDSRTRVVLGLLKALAEIADPDSLRAFAPLLSHPDGDVRRDAILAVKRIGTHAAFPILHEVLRGGDREMRVLALGALEGLPPQTYRGPLLGIARSRDFATRNYFEKRELLVALARAANPEVEEFLTQLTRRRSMFHRQANAELRACAVTALARCGTRSALAAVEACRKDRNDQVRRAAVQALCSVERS
jgi:HEAT repeat protein